MSPFVESSLTSITSLLQGQELEAIRDQILASPAMGGVDDALETVRESLAQFEGSSSTSIGYQSYVDEDPAADSDDCSDVSV